MARLNASNPTVLYGRQSSNATKTTATTFKTTIPSPLRSRTKQQTKKSSGFSDFKIFEDEEQSDEEGTANSSSESPRTVQEEPTVPLKLTHTNSITSGLSKRVSQDSAGSSRSGSDFDEEENSDKENIFFDDEAEEASDDSEEEGEQDRVEEGETIEDETSLGEERDLENDMLGRQLTVEREKSKFLRYRETNVREEIDDSQSELSGDSDDGYNSLEDFIVSDNEDMDYYDDGLQDEEDEADEEEEIKPPTPKQPIRRRLLRGRKPRTSSIEKQAEKLSLSDESYSPKSNAVITYISRSNSPAPLRFSSPFTCLLPNETQNEASEIIRDKKAKRSPLRESINSMSSISMPIRNQQDNRMQTPPTSPSKNTQLSPSKTASRIPPSPHRHSSDAFWSQDVTNAWNDQWSPPKQRTKSKALERLLSALGEDSNRVEMDATAAKGSLAPTPIETPQKSPSKSPSKTALKKAEIAQRKEAAARKKAFDDKKGALAQEFLIALDEATSNGQVNEMAQSTGGIKIEWSKTLRSTAGRAKWKQERIKQAGKDIKYIHHASIELAERIIDDEDRLLNTLAHEYCHLASYMISSVRNQPHGASFKEWGRKCVDAIRNHPDYKNYPIEVTTKHSYEIDYKYVWLCIDCGHKYGRHSKSIDPSKAKCSLCKGGLQQVKPKPRNVSPKKKNSSTEMSQARIALAENMDNMVESLGNASLG